MATKQQNYLLLLILLLGCTLASCHKEELLPDLPTASSHRTVLVYLGVNNDFSNEAEQKIRQLQSGWSRAIDGNLLVYTNVEGKSTLVHIYHSGQRGNVADTLETREMDNSADPATLTRVLHTVRRYRPSASYGLVVLSHASGWLPTNMSLPSPTIKSVVLDRGNANSNTSSYMELVDFVRAIPYKLDFVIFDACFMGAVEVAYELRDKADYVVASPAEVLVPGFVYSNMPQHLFAPQPDLKAVARDFYEYYDNDRQSGLPRSATVSVVKTDELEELATLIKSIAQSSVPLSNVEDIQTYGYGKQSIYFDLGDYLQKLSPERFSQVQAALKRCVLYKACTSSYYSTGATELQPIHTFSGLSVYIPQKIYPKANEAYKELKWAKESTPPR